MGIPKIKLLPKKERSIINRHPWIFSGAVHNSTEAHDGDIVEVVSADNKTLGFGFFSAKSQIVCRMFDWEEKPPSFSLEYWKEKISTALHLRKKEIINNQTNCYRLIHAEGDFFPGLIIDIYDHVAVVQILIVGVERIKDLLINSLRELGFINIYVKTKVSSHILEDIRGASGWISGTADSPILIRENNLLFNVDYIKGQKTGFFLDQRENRKLLSRYSKDKVVLNAFSYTGGFSVYALAGGAREVHSLDISKEAVALADENVQLNSNYGKHITIAQDCFDYLKEMPADFFDIIVLDPPAFAKNSRAVENASRGYKQINLRAFQKIKPGGLLFTFSCSQNISKELFQKIIFGAAADAKRNVRIIHQVHQPADHPINIFHPEGEYLKGLVLWVE